MPPSSCWKHQHRASAKKCLCLDCKQDYACLLKILMQSPFKNILWMLMVGLCSYPFMAFRYWSWLKKLLAKFPALGVSVRERGCEPMLSYCRQENPGSQIPSLFGFADFQFPLHSEPPYSRSERTVVWEAFRQVFTTNGVYSIVCCPLFFPKRMLFNSLSWNWSFRFSKNASDAIEPISWVLRYVSEAKVYISEVLGRVSEEKVNVSEVIWYILEAKVSISRVLGCDSEVNGWISLALGFVSEIFVLISKFILTDVCLIGWHTTSLHHQLLLFPHYQQRSCSLEIAGKQLFIRSKSTV